MRKPYTHLVLKPFFAEETNDVVQPMTPFTPHTSVRGDDLERLKLIVRSDVPARAVKPPHKNKQAPGVARA